MAETPPTVYYLYGDDEFAMAEFVRSLKDKLGDPTTAAMNLQEFIASELDWQAIESAAFSMPFLSPRRLVVLDLVDRLFTNAAAIDRLVAFLDQIPESTAFVLLDRTASSAGKSNAQRSKLRSWVDSHPERAYKRACDTPRGAGFIAWLQKHAASDGGSIDREAAELLAEWIQEDPRLAAQELRKLLDFVDRQHPVSINDVEQCTPYRGQSNIFSLVDAIGQRRGDEAIRLLHHVLVESEPGHAFAMIVRQFRLIMQAREMLDAGRAPDSTIHHSEFVVRKITAQARNFSMADIETIYHTLLDIDLRSKTGQMEIDASLDTLIASIAA